MSKKYYDNALKHSGVSSREFVSSFGAGILKKFGWKEGSGLGKDHTGRLTCVQFERREERAGLGVTSSNNTVSEWTNWWDTLYDSTIQRIQLDRSANNESYSKTNESSTRKRKKRKKSTTLAPLNSMHQKGKLLRLQNSDGTEVLKQPTEVFKNQRNECSTKGFAKAKVKKTKK